MKRIVLIIVILFLGTAAYGKSSLTSGITPSVGASDSGIGGGIALNCSYFFIDSLSLGFSLEWYQRATKVGSSDYQVAFLPLDLAVRYYFLQKLIKNGSLFLGAGFYFAPYLYSYITGTTSETVSFNHIFGMSFTFGYRTGDFFSETIYLEVYIGYKFTFDKGGIYDNGGSDEKILIDMLSLRMGFGMKISFSH